MEAKEKAKELFDKFYQAQVQILGKETSVIVEVEESIAKECAIIAVDEIMKAVPFNDHTKKLEFEETAMFSDNCFITYWQLVKNELNKL